MPIDKLVYFWNRAKNGGRKSIKFDEFDPNFEVFPDKNGIVIHYIKAIAKIL